MSPGSKRPGGDRPRGGPARGAEERGANRRPRSGTSRPSARDGDGPARPARPARPSKVKAAPVEPMRIQRALARAGVASRRHAEELVAAGRVLVNGQPAKLGQSVQPGKDEITVDGRRIAAPAAEAKWIVLNKPAGVMTTKSDPQGRKTVFSLVPDYPGLTYVGRLDLLTEGVLLLTTDGEAAHKLTHPSSELERSYLAHVRGDAEEAVARVLEEGVELEDGPVHPRAARARHLGRGRWLFEITLTEGRNREVRRICEALDLQVDKLVRTQFGPITLGELAPGSSRTLTPRERTALGKLLGRAP